MNPYNIELLDIAGKLIYKQTAQKNVEEVNPNLLQTQNLPAGIYLLRTTSLLGQVSTKKIFVH